jgi:hypothetical protein
MRDSFRDERHVIMVKSVQPISANHANHANHMVLYTLYNSSRLTAIQGMSEGD